MARRVGVFFLSTAMSDLGDKVRQGAGLLGLISATRPGRRGFRSRPHSLQQKQRRRGGARNRAAGPACSRRPTTGLHTLVQHGILSQDRTMTRQLAALADGLKAGFAGVRSKAMGAAKKQAQAHAQNHGGL